MGHQELPDNLKNKDFFSASAGVLLQHKPLIALLLFIVVISFMNPEFFSICNLLNILRQTSVNAIIAVGMTFVVLTSGIDLAVGSVLAFTGAIAATLISLDFHILIAVSATLCTGAGLGYLSGFVIAKGKVQAFIATLATMTFLRGATMVYTDGRPVSALGGADSDAFVMIGSGYFLGVPIPVYLMIIIFVVAWFVLQHTRFGRYVYALGGNESATRLSGINVDRVKMAVYATSGLLSAVAGIIVTSRLVSAQPTAGSGYELDAIAAVVLGGTRLSGGRGRVMGTLVGALIIGVLSNALNLLNISSYYQLVAKALVILLAVLVDTHTMRWIRGCYS